MKADATSYAAPGRNYFEAVLGHRKVLVLLDESAQYAARLETAIPDGGDQLAACLMGLHGYARTHTGIAVVLTLASQVDAFAHQTQTLTRLLGDVQGQEVAEASALGIVQRATSGVRSVSGPSRVVRSSSAIPAGIGGGGWRPGPIGGCGPRPGRLARW